jgi:hypothetical protein
MHQLRLNERAAPWSFLNLGRRKRVDREILFFLVQKTSRKQIKEGAKKKNEPRISIPFLLIQLAIYLAAAIGQPGPLSSSSHHPPLPPVDIRGPMPHMHAGSALEDAPQSSSRRYVFFSSFGGVPAATHVCVVCPALPAPPRRRPVPVRGERWARGAGARMHGVPAGFYISDADHGSPSCVPLLLDFCFPLPFRAEEV